MNVKIQQILLPVWHYLNQPVFDNRASSVWNLKQFNYLYKIQFLEKCWYKQVTSEVER
jgi:hypothetical protein